VTRARQAGRQESRSATAGLPETLTALLRAAAALAAQAAKLMNETRDD
jgi:hypothetical protein